MKKVIIVGAGLFGLVCSERLSKKGYSPIIFEKRNEIGGNCATYYKDNIEIHKYGSHIFHTTFTDVYNYIKNFTDFNEYKHRVYTEHNGKKYIIPLNRNTINSFFNINLQSKEDVKKFLKEKSEKLEHEPKNFEEQVKSTLGCELYNAFFKEYTKKQWGVDPKHLSPEIAKRIPIVYSDTELFFPNDKYQGIPKDGYNVLFSNLLKESKAEIVRDDFLRVKGDYKNVPIIFSGQIDKFFNYKFGQLGWRSLEFSLKTYDQKNFQGTSVVNFADSEPKWTRRHEFKHYMVDKKEVLEQGKTVIMSEKSAEFIEGKNDAYYPVNSENDEIIFNRYLELANNQKNIFFGGRLGAYKYFNMDQTIKNALELIDSKF